MTCDAKVMRRFYAHTDNILLAFHLIAPYLQGTEGDVNILFYGGGTAATMHAAFPQLIVNILLSTISREDLRAG